MTCPGCNGKGKQITHPDAPLGTVYECRKCHGLFGSLYLGEFYQLVRLTWCRCQTDSAPDLTGRYFDFETLGSHGVDRRHGWFHEPCKGLLQVG